MRLKQIKFPTDKVQILNLVRGAVAWQQYLIFSIIEVYDTMNMAVQPDLTENGMPEIMIMLLNFKIL